MCQKLHTRGLWLECGLGGALVLLLLLQWQTGCTWPSTTQQLLFPQARIPVSRSYVPEELNSLLVCITAQYKVTRGLAVQLRRCAGSTLCLDGSPCLH